MWMKGWFRARLALYAVLAIEGFFFGWVVLLTLIAALMFEMVHKAGTLKDTIFRDLPFEILQHPDASAGLTVGISNGTLVGCGAFFLLQMLSIGCIMYARLKRSYKHLIFPLIWIFLYSGLMVGGIAHGIKEIKAMPPEIPEPPVLAFKQPPRHPHEPTIAPMYRITLPPLPRPPEPMQEYFRDLLGGVCGLLLQIVLLKSFLGLFSLITLVVHMRIFRKRAQISSKPAYV